MLGLEVPSRLCEVGSILCRVACFEDQARPSLWPTTNGSMWAPKTRGVKKSFQLDAMDMI